jgi:hypothetical protein
MNSIYFVSQFITYFRRSENQKSRTTWVQWREIVQEIYREKYFQSKIKLIINSGTADSSKLKTIEEYTTSFQLFKDEDKKEIIELIQLYQELLKREKEIILADRFEVYMQKLTVTVDKQILDSIPETVKQWITNKEEDKFYFKIKLEGTLQIIIADFLLRFVSLWYFKVFTNSDFDSADTQPRMLFIISQFILIPLGIFVFSYFRDKRIEKNTQKIFSEIGRNDLKITNSHSPWNYLFTFILLIFGILISIIVFDFSSQDYGIVIPIFTVLYGVYFMILLSFFSKKKPSISQIIYQLDKINLNQVKTNLNHNENDEEIIELDVSLRSANEKMEAYVLEAALFGALAFSGFLQLISSSNVSIESLSSFSSNFYGLFEGLVNFSTEATLKSINQLLSKDGILSLMAFLTLFCSVFFLAVIASRLRFNDLSDSIDKSLQLSKIYNDKEENLISMNGGNTNESSNIITKIIRKHLIQGNLTLEQTLPIMEFMRFFRTLGIFTFFIIVVSGGLFVSVQLSLVLAFIMFISFLFFKLKIIIQYIKNVTTQFQEFYFKIESKVFYFILASIAACFILRSLSFTSIVSQILIVSSFLLIFIHYLLSLFIPEKLEDEEISDSIFMNGNRNKIVLKKLYKISLAILFLGLMFKIMHFPGAGLLLMIGIFLLAVYFIMGQKTKNNNKILGLIYRSSFSLMIIGGMFYIMHWPGSGFIRILSNSLLLISFVLLFRFKNQLLQSTKNITITLTILGVLLQFSLFRFALTTLSFNYPVYLEKMEIARIRTKITEPTDLGYLDAKSKSELDSLKSYMTKNDKYLEKIGGHDLSEYCWIILENQTDTTILNHGLKWSNWIIVDDPYYSHYLLNIEYLIKLKHYKEALEKINNPKDIKAESDEFEFKSELNRLKQICLKNLPASN